MTAPEPEVIEGSVRRCIEVAIKQRDPRTQRSAVHAAVSKIMDAYNALIAQRDAAVRGRDAVVGALDDAMVVAGIGVFRSGDDARLAIHSLCVHAQSIGEYFAQEELNDLRAKLAAAEAVVDAVQRNREGLKIMWHSSQGHAINLWRPLHERQELAQRAYFEIRDSLTTPTPTEATNDDA
jgi:hypothetical protein